MQYLKIYYKTKYKKNIISVINPLHSLRKFLRTLR
jgi:hypothetical protein